MSYVFNTGEALLALCENEQLPLHEVMLRRELELTDSSRAALREEMHKNLTVMRASIEEGLQAEYRSVSGLSGGDAQKLFSRASGTFMGADAARAVAAAMAVVEVNASMGKIVAAPTAGASGILPGTLLGLAEVRGWKDGSLIDALFAAAAVGVIIAANATLAGSEGGCQAETGSAAAMTAAALAHLSGAKPAVCLNAAAIALQNVLGLVCDPVAGLVECPCIKRNALGAANAMLSADLALSGVGSIIPFDETVDALRTVGRLLPSDLRETARGGLAATKTAKEITKRLGLSAQAE
ncbi:MAG: L-serine ammonia-lyase, iron-sulfur-dependent, subunit alpha [Christensenellaceae bacterium]|nr:L-serine ammonia-lyase, iron-sulfur-dependent, subunit alpha [Christensenellaceae bacterium]